MKKVFLLFFLLFFVFSCSEGKVFKDPESSSGGQVVSSELQDCIAKFPIKNDFNSFWAFKNKSDNLCYYFGFYGQFFLINENLEKNISENLKNDLETGYFVKNDGETEEELLNNLITFFSDRKYNLLYSEKIDEVHKYIFQKYRFQEPPIIALFDEKNILDLYLEKFKELDIILPEKFEKVGKFDKENLLKWLNSRSEETKNISEKNFVPVPNYFYEIDFENLYQILYEKQKN